MNSVFPEFGAEDFSREFPFYHILLKKVHWAYCWFLDFFTREYPEYMGVSDKT